MISHIRHSIYDNLVISIFPKISIDKAPYMLYAIYRYENSIL